MVSISNWLLNVGSNTYQAWFLLFSGSTEQVLQQPKKISLRSLSTYTKIRCWESVIGNCIQKTLGWWPSWLLRFRHCRISRRSEIDGSLYLFISRCTYFALFKIATNCQSLQYRSRVYGSCRDCQRSHLVCTIPRRITLPRRYSRAFPCR